MSEQQNPAGTQDTPAPAAQPQPTQPNAPAPPPAQADQQNPPWLGDRIKQAKTSAIKDLLGELSIDSVADAKAALQELADLKAAQLSETERRDQQIRELTKKAERADVLAKRFADSVERELAQLPEHLRVIVETSAGSDPDEKWRQLQVVKATLAAREGAEPPPPPPPANTTPSGTPPNPAPPSTTRDTYERLTGVHKALFGQFNATDIHRDQ